MRNGRTGFQPIGVKIRFRVEWGKVIDAWPMNGNYLYTDMWPHVSRILPELEESARRCGAVRRCRRLPSAEALIRMGVAYAVSDLSFKGCCCVGQGA